MINDANYEMNTITTYKTVMANMRIVLWFMDSINPRCGMFKLMQYCAESTAKTTTTCNIRRNSLQLGPASKAP